MPNYLLKRDSVDIKLAEFEELSQRSSNVVRAYKHGKKSNTEVTEHPLAKNFIRHDATQIQPESIEICISPLFDPEIAAEQAATVEQEEEAVETQRLAKLRQTWEKEWEIKLDVAIEKAQAEGYDRGFEEAKQVLAQGVELEKKAFKDALLNLQSTWESFINRSETLLLEIALEIAHFLVDAPLPERFSKSTEIALLEALEILSSEVPVKLSLNPVDFLRLQESGLTKHIEDQFATLRWDPQPTLKEGNWIIQTPRQAIRRVSEELLASLRDRFGLNENTERDMFPRQKPVAQEAHQIPPATNIAVTTTSMADQPELDLSGSMSFTAATSTAAGEQDAPVDQ